VLLGKDYVAKVSDYGMARDVYEELMYKKETQVFKNLSNGEYTTSASVFIIKYFFSLEVY